MISQTFILIGRSGCGKGTQGQLLAEHLKKQDKDGREVYYLETGANFREFFKEKNYSAELARKIYEHDERQPDFIAVWMWAHLFLRDLKGEEHLFADGTCRSLPEAQIFDTALKFYGRKANVIYIDVSRKWSEGHLLKRGREDDTNLKKIEGRLNWFDSDTMPAVEFFRNHPDYNFVEVSGERPIEVVHADIVEKIKVFE